MEGAVPTSVQPSYIKTIYRDTDHTLSLIDLFNIVVREYVPQIPQGQIGMTYKGL